MSETEKKIRYIDLTEKKPSKNKGKIIVAGLIILVLIVVILGMKFEERNTNLKFIEKDYISRIDVEGVIKGKVDSDIFGNTYGYNHNNIMNYIDEIMNDTYNKGLILYVNSPGGGVYESDELYEKIRLYQTYTKRPVYSVMGGTAASGGYYISAPCEKIIANRNTITGSIGVKIGPFYDFSTLMNQYGIKSNTFTSGPNKAMGSPSEEMTQEQKDIMQSIVDEAYNQFLEVVSSGRNIEKSKLIPIADGRIYTAMQAKNVGLIDEIGTYEDAFNDMKTRYKINKAVEEHFNQNDKSRIFGKSSFSISKIFKESTGSDLKLLNEMIKENQNFPLNYIM